MIALDIVIDLALSGDRAAANRLSGDTDPPGPLVDPHLPPLARAALALGEERWEDAASQADEAERLPGRGLDPSAAILDRERIARLGLTLPD